MSSLRPVEASETLATRILHENVEYRKLSVNTSAGNVTVHIVLADRSAIADGTISIGPVTPSSTAGQTGSVSAIAARVDGYAAIDGPYFASSGSRIYPLGFTVIDGKLFQVGNLNRPMVGLDIEGNLNIEIAHPRAFVTSEAYFEPSWLWAVNTSAGADAVTYYDRSWGATVGSQGGIAVAVGPIDPQAGEGGIIEVTGRASGAEEFDGEVVEVSNGGSVTIPVDGFALVFRGRALGDAERYTIGNGVSLYLYDLPSGWELMRWIATLGPWFVHNGHIRDFSDETSYDSNITGASVRSVIGTTWNDEIFFAKTTGPGLTVRQAADALVECNVREAVMCDSGSSSGMWVKGVGTVGATRGIPLGFAVWEGSGEGLSEPENLKVWTGNLSRY